MYLCLPVKYPQIDFIFRPHPLWKINLKVALGWPEIEINNFLEKLLKNKNVTYSEDFNYIELFNQSCGLIHDCGSFVAEYLYTLKPCCFMMNNLEIYKNFNSVGKMCLDAHYQAFDEGEIFKFIEKVILSNSDDLMKERERIAKKFVINNHGQSSNLILKAIEDEFFGKLTPSFPDDQRAVV
jgi:hypothetical protein